MSSPLVILVGGYLTAGKDAFADHLVEQHNFIKLGMSDTLALALYRLNPWVAHPKQSKVAIFRLPLKALNRIFRLEKNYYRRYQDIVDEVGYVEAKQIVEVRGLLQILGTEVGRQLLGENIWVDAAKKKILELTAAGSSVVITGIRFPNELALEHELRELDINAASVWVNRPGLSAAAHSSEGSVAPESFEYTLDNVGDLEDLKTASTDILVLISSDYA